MSLQTQIMDAMKIAMKAKDTQSLQALRAVKAAMLLAQTESGAKQELSEEDMLNILQKQVKQRKDSAAIFTEQNRNDLAEPELAEAEVIAKFLPKQMDASEIALIIDEIITQAGVSSMADMGKVMGMASGKLNGKADGKTISTIVKERLSK